MVNHILAWHWLARAGQRLPLWLGLSLTPGLSHVPHFRVPSGIYGHLDFWLMLCGNLSVAPKKEFWG